MYKVKIHNYDKNGVKSSFIKEYDWIETDIQPFQNIYLNPKMNAFDLEEKANLRTYNYFENLKLNKDYIIEKLLHTGELAMFYGPSHQFKSLLTHHLAICISRGDSFLNLKTKKHRILISDKENNDQIIKDRWFNLRKGNNIRKKDTPIFYLDRKEGDLDNPDFLKRLRCIIEENRIDLVIFDTLHRHSDYDENSANDLNRIYMTVFQPLIADTGCSIMFLHHTDKSKNNFRGSVDFLGMCDVVFSVKRKSDKSSNFTIKNEKGRRGEIDDIKGVIKFNDKDKEIKIKFIPPNPDEDMNENETQQVENNLRQQVKEQIKSYFVSNNRLTTKDIKFKLNTDNPDCSKSTFKRSLKELVDNGILIKSGRGNYVRGEYATELNNLEPID